MNTLDLIESVKKSYPELCGFLFFRGMYKEISFGPLLLYYIGRALDFKNDEEVFRNLTWSLKEFDEHGAYIYGDLDLLEGNVKFYGFIHKSQKEKTLQVLRKNKEKLKTENWIEL